MRHAEFKNVVSDLHFGRKIGKKSNLKKNVDLKNNMHVPLTLMKSDFRRVLFFFLGAALYGSNLIYIIITTEFHKK